MSFNTKQLYSLASAPLTSGSCLFHRKEKYETNGSRTTFYTWGNQTVHTLRAHAQFPDDNGTACEGVAYGGRPGTQQLCEAVSPARSYQEYEEENQSRQEE